MKIDKKHLILFFLIFAIGIFFRVYKFNQIPNSLNWDEVAIGWNAASIWEAKIDQYGTRWPLTFKSYGDFKAPFLIYVTAPFIGFFGEKDWVVRLPILICSILTIPIFYLLSIEIGKLIKFEEKQIKIFSLFSTFLLSISPWHIRFSRGAFEAQLALFFILLGAYLFFLSFKNHYLYILSGLFFIFSLYTYHSPKIFVPLFLILLFIKFRKKIFSQIKNHKIILSLYLLFLLCLAFPLIKETFFGQAGERRGSLILFENNQLVKIDFNLLKQILNNLWQHISPRFYIFGKDDNFRNNLKNIGLMPTIQYIFFLIGIFNIFKNKKQSFLLIWFLLALIPGIISKPETVPHSIRTLNALPAIIFISSIGFIFLLDLIKNKKIMFFKNKIKIEKIILISISLFFVISIKFFYEEYFISFPLYNAYDWQYGYKETAQIAKEYEPKVDKIIISSKYGHPYLFFAFYQQRDPLLVIWGEMSKYQYLDTINWDQDQFRQNTLLIGTDEEIPQNISEDKGEVVNKIKFPDGNIAFVIVKTK